MPDPFHLQLDTVKPVYKDPAQERQKKVVDGLYVWVLLVYVSMRIIFKGNNKCGL